MPFDKLTDGLESEREVSMSDPMSRIAQCFPELGGACVTLRYSLDGGEDEDFVCTSEQVEAVEEAFWTGLDKSNDDNAAALSAASRAVDKLRKKPIE